ncbi:hypothetical protein [Mucilaginibacter sp. OK098]|uniref:hypothetical protein n=1 Tax=Mucilaginibacter sp. OK098 TaxID=1855297 RepID=UPI000916CDAC|nr:hypothetical protein [Mucilaginibacter sp. OK098]SHM09966.1 hypothetical protein SAMN05216524_101800 [Mucilaginibacter sp. OK098]
MKKIPKGLWLPFISLCILGAPGSAQSQKSALTTGKAVAFPALATVEKETFLNTITTTGPDGIRYKLVQEGDRLPKLYLNNKLIPTGELDRYTALIDKLTSILWERQKEAARQNEARINSQQLAIVNDLVKDQIIKNQKDALSFRLTLNEFIVNGQNQSFTIFNRYMKKYINNADKMYQFNYSSK